MGKITPWTINHFCAMTNAQLPLKKPWLERLKTFMASMFLFLSFLTIEEKYAMAIEDYLPPASDEYLLVIVTQTVGKKFREECRFSCLWTKIFFISNPYTETSSCDR